MLNIPVRAKYMFQFFVFGLCVLSLGLAINACNKTEETAVVSDSTVVDTTVVDTIFVDSVVDSVK